MLQSVYTIEGGANGPTSIFLNASLGTTFVEGLGTMIIGMVTVFLILIALSFVLYLLKYLNPDTRKEAQKPVEPKIEPVKPTVDIQPDIIEQTDDLELIAVITATIAASLNTTSDRLQVKSIKRVSNWNSVSKREQQRNII